MVLNHKLFLSFKGGQRRDNNFDEEVNQSDQLQQKE